MKDVYGNEITRGTTIVYPARKGSGMWLTQATVNNVHETETTVPKFTWNGKRWVRDGVTTKVTASIDAIRNGVVFGDTMEAVDEKLVTLTRTNHIIVVAE